MRNKYIALLFLILTLMLSGCGGTQSQIIKIAVMGNPDAFHPGYQDGIERAVRDLNNEYSGSGYSVECEFCSDDGSYEAGAAIIDTLVADKTVTAVIGSNNMEINKTAAHVFDEAGKLFIVPYFLYDSVYLENHYDTVFSLCKSAKTVGELLCIAATQTTAKRWVVCADDDEFELAEMNGFLKYAAAGGIQTVDCVNISELENNFDEVYKRWETLGVEGVVLFPTGNEGFEILKKLKRRNPDLICGSDTVFDNSDLLVNDAELRQAMTGFIMANAFVLDCQTDEEAELVSRMAEEYTQETGNNLDTWYVHSYNTIRMIGDTAIKNKTCSSSSIARLLHENGYEGVGQRFYFNANGSQAGRVYAYEVFNENGYTDVYMYKE